MKELLCVGLGSFCGGILRYSVSLLLKTEANQFPLSTLLVNISGCFLMGLLLAISLKSSNLNQNFMLFLTLGFCGGLTTFSSFSKETLQLLQNNLFAYAIVYVLCSVILSILASFLGFYLGK